MRLATIFDHNFQSTGSSPFSLNIRFTLENGFEPKNPLFAEKGEGCALLITELHCRFIEATFSCAFLPHKTNTTFSFSDNNSKILLVNLSHPRL